MPMPTALRNAIVSAFDNAETSPDGVWCVRLTVTLPVLGSRTVKICVDTKEYLACNTPQGGYFYIRINVRPTT